MKLFRTCFDCGERKPTGEFVRRSKAENRYSNLCLECNRIRNKAGHRRRKLAAGCDPVALENRARYKESKKEWRLTTERIVFDKIVRMHTSAKHRAKRKGLNFNITVNDLLNLYVDECPIFKTKLNWEHRGNGASHDSPSLDRKVPSLGYIKGNLWIISHRANTIKSDATPEELIAVADAMFYC